MKSHFTKIIRFLLPPESWKITVLVLIAVMIGLLAYLLYISRAASYLSDDPKTCVNCHVMSSQFASWNHSSHRMVTNCNDCHVPHNNFISHYYFKAKDGLRHSTIFTLRKEPQVIMIRDPGIKVVQQNCKRCHLHLVEGVSAFKVTSRADCSDKGKLCWECHRMTPHTRTNSLSSAPNAFVPLPESAVPGWLKKLLEKDKKERAGKF